MSGARRIRCVALAALLASGCGGAPRGACNPRPDPGELGTVCGFQRPEDVEAIPAAGLLLVSEMRAADAPGALSALALGDSGARPRRLWPASATGEPASRLGDPECAGPPPADRFEPHGIGAGPPARGGVPVAVVSHGERESVELFELRGSGPAARLAWRGCVALPPGAGGNDVALSPDGSLLVSNYQPPGGRAATLYHSVRGGVGAATGELLYWSRASGWRALPGTRAANPNGVLASPDGGRVYLAATGSGVVRGVPLAAAGEAREFAVGGHPDNLSWSSRGTILAVTHTDGLAVLGCVWGRQPCRSPWALLEIDPVSGRTSELLRHDGAALGAASSAAEFGGLVYLGAVYDDRIGLWRPAPTSGQTRGRSAKNTAIGRIGCALTRSLQGCLPNPPRV